jgi:hypothetical protein
MQNITHKMHKPENGFQSKFTPLLPTGYGFELDDISWAFAKAANYFDTFFFSFDSMIPQLKKDINENHHR